MHNSENIPIYSLANFKTGQHKDSLFQVEVFDANRHFEVAYPHKHDFYEILFLTSGSGDHIIDNNKYTIDPPCVFFMSPGQAHKLALSNDINGYIFLFTEEFYQVNKLNENKLLEYPFFYSIDQANPPLLIANKEDAAFLTNVFMRSSKVELAGPYSEEYIRASLELILQTCMQWYKPDSEHLSPSRTNVLVKSFLKLMEENYQNNLSIADYAGKLAITANHLSQMVKKATGKTPIKLLQDKVVIEAKRMLVHSEMTVTQISDSLSFTDQSYFTKYFKKACGLTPLRFKKEKLDAEQKV